MTYKLMEHQENALAFLDMNPEGLLIAYDIGTGKTMIALEAIRRRIVSGMVHNALIICPASLIGTWGQAIDDCANFGYTPDDIETLKKTITITSYQRTYQTVKKILRHRDGTHTVVSERVIRDNIDKEWGIIVCDESHNLGGYNSIQTKTCITLAKHAKTRIAMSGTPLHGGKGKQDWGKMYGQIQFITAGKKWHSWRNFCTLYVETYNIWHKPARWREKHCEDIFKEYTISCRREDCIDLPEYTETVIPCDLVEKKMYNDLIKGDFDKYGITCEIAGTKYGKLLQIVSGSCKTDNGTLDLHTSKDSALENILESTNEKIIIFCRFTASVDRCVNVAKICERNVTFYDGRCTKETWREFQDGDRDTLVIQYDSGSAGLNLQAAHICVFYEPTLSALKLEQATGRTYRKGQSEKCVYYYLSTVNSIEHKVWGIVRDGRDVNNEMLEKLARGLL